MKLPTSSEKVRLKDSTTIFPFFLFASSKRVSSFGATRIIRQYISSYEAKVLDLLEPFPRRKKHRAGAGYGRHVGTSSKGVLICCELVSSKEKY